MIDTVRFLAKWRLKAEVVAALKTAGWFRTGAWYFHTVTGASGNGDPRVRFGIRHEKLGIIGGGPDGGLEWVQASLPRVLHGSNGRLIWMPWQVDESLEALFSLLGEIATPEVRLIEFTRVDLVLNLPGDPRRFVLAHRGARHPWVRNEDVQYGEHAIRFPGKQRVLQLYWKQKERADKSGFKLPALAHSVRAELQLKTKLGLKFEDVVIVRYQPLDIIREQLTIRKPKLDLQQPGVIYSSHLVDCAANMTLARQTAEACAIIHELTAWDVRLLSKSHLLPEVAKLIPARFKHRVIYGVSTGTLDDKLANSIEQGTPPVSKRIESLHRLQDTGHRCFGMICPSLPQTDYAEFAEWSLIVGRTRRRSVTKPPR